MVFQRAQPSSIPLLAELARKSWQQAYTGILSQEQISYMLELLYSPPALLRLLENSSMEYYLLVDGARGAEGFLLLEHGAENLSTKIHRLYLLDVAKGAGKGRSAVAFAAHRALQAGSLRITLNVNRHNPAKQFYEHIGLKVLKEECIDIGSGFVMDDFVLGRDLMTV